MDTLESVAGVDPTGILSATTAGIRLVGTIVNLAGKRGDGNTRGQPGVGGQPDGRQDVRGMTAESLASVARIDNEAQRRAYEKINMVLKTFGDRMVKSGLVDLPALATALTQATAHIEVKLFSTDTNMLFQSLAQKLNDANLVNSVFTSIYLLGYLTNELTSSLPGWKESYMPLSQRIIQQLFKSALGLDGFKENLTANLDAYKTLAVTAGLLRPTDIEYKVFRDFPTFSPTRYSKASWADKISNKNTYNKLIKHFETHGFPQPWTGFDVGMVRDWRFLNSDANTRQFDVDNSDKNIGEEFGKVLYWLVCSASRLSPGMAIVAYYEQHIELVKWLGPRFGFRVVSGATDFNMTGPHAQMRTKMREIFASWVIIMPSVTLLTQRQQQAAAEVQQASIPQKSDPSQITAADRMSIYRKASTASPAVATPSPRQGPPSPISISESPSAGIGASPVSPIGVVSAHSVPTGVIKNDTAPSEASAPPSELSAPSGGIPSRRQSVIPSPTSQHGNLPTHNKATASSQDPSIAAGASRTQTQMNPSHLYNPTATSDPANGSYFPPPGSIASATTPISPQAPSTFSRASSVSAGTPSSIVSPTTARPRKRAPPPPRVVLATALYDYYPDEDDDESFPFQAGDTLEIIEKNKALTEDGWCRARVKGSKRLGLAPIDYLEEIPGQTPVRSQTMGPSGASGNTQTIPEATIVRHSTVTHNEAPYLKQQLLHGEKDQFSTSRSLSGAPDLSTPMSFPYGDESTRGMPVDHAPESKEYATLMNIKNLSDVDPPPQTYTGNSSEKNPTDINPPPGYPHQRPNQSHPPGMPWMNPQNPYGEHTPHHQGTNNAKQLRNASMAVGGVTAALGLTAGIMHVTTAAQDQQAGGDQTGQQTQDQQGQGQDQHQSTQQDQNQTSQQDTQGQDQQQTQQQDPSGTQDPYNDPAQTDQAVDPLAAQNASDSMAPDAYLSNTDPTTGITSSYPLYEVPPTDPNAAMDPYAAADPNTAVSPLASLAPQPAGADPFAAAPADPTAAAGVSPFAGMATDQSVMAPPVDPAAGGYAETGYADPGYGGEYVDPYAADPYAGGDAYAADYSGGGEDPMGMFAF